jgi:hypothetical protein
VSGQLHTDRYTPRGKRQRCLLGRRLDGIQSWFGRCGEEKNFLPLPGMEPWPDGPLRCTMAILALRIPVTAKIRSMYFPNTGVECYHCNNPLGINGIIFQAMCTYFSEEICAM